MRLLSPTVIVPEQEKGRPFWAAQHTGVGSVVGVMQANKPSIITGAADEIYVKWMDVTGRESFGWIAKHTPMDRKVKEKKLFRAGVAHDEKVKAWDTLRYYITRNEGWDTERWIKRFGKTHLPLLHAVIRELGGRAPKKDDKKGTESISKCLSLIISNKGNPAMTKKTKKEKSEVKHEVESAESAAKKSSTKKTKSGSKKTAAKKSSKKTRAEGAGRVSAMAGKVIVRKVSDNPRREGSNGFKNWKLYKKGMTYEQFLAAGGHRGCLAKDVERGHVKLVTKK
jgi:hypothetical protein